MQEKQVTIADNTFKLDLPFLVLATQNPVEQEGAYKLPEAQLDRFMLNVLVDYNSFDEEFEIVNRVAKDGFKEINQVASIEDIQKLKEQFNSVHVDEAIQRYMLKIVFATRDPKEYGLEDIAEFIEYGASPRASIDLYRASTAHALIEGKDYVTPLNVAQMAYDVLRHRLILTYKAQAKGVDANKIIERILGAIKAP